MSARRSAAITATAFALAMAGGIATAATDAKRPRGVVEDCSRLSGFGQSLRDFARPRNLVVGPLALLRAGEMLGYAPGAIGEPGGNKLFVVVKGGHQVTLELSHRTRRDAGFVFGSYREPNVRLHETRRVVTFVACRRGEYQGTPPPSGWPVSGWVGGLIARSPMCVPLRVWVDDEPRLRRAVIRFGVRSC